MELIEYFLSGLDQLGQLLYGLGLCIALPSAFLIFKHKLQYSESTLEDFPFRLTSFAALVIIFLALGTSFGRFSDNFFQLKFPAFGLIGAVAGLMLGIVMGVGVWRRKK